MFTRELVVLPSDVSCLGIIKLRNLLNYFQDTASIAVQNIEGSTTELIAKGYAWVLTKYEIEFLERLPALDEKFFIHTFHDSNHAYNSLRIFQVTNSNNDLIAWAKTSWLLLDFAAGRPVKPAVHLPELLERDCKEIDPEFKDIPKMPDEFNEIEQPVRFHDLDYNSHVNNAVYFEWIFEATPLDLMTHELKSVYANFRSGVKAGENVKIQIARTNSDNNIFLYNILRENVIKPSATFMCCWK